MIFARIGAALYIVWGVLHVVAAQKVYALGQTLEPGMVQGRIYQSAWNLLFFAIFGIVVGLVCNWRNSRLGYWLNLVMVSVGDIGFLLTIVLPGYLPLFLGLVGPIVWLVALAFSTKGILNTARKSVPSPASA